jgi:site-specific DNA-methyltransferase (adenine-specific)
VTRYHGDCWDITEWQTAHVLVTDPPYGIQWRRGENKRRSSRSHDGIAGDGDTTARDAALAAMTGKPAVVFGSLYAKFPADLSQVLIYRKPADAGVVGSITGFRRDIEAIFLVGPWPRRNAQRSSVLTSRAANIGGTSSPAGRTGHPHTKPLDIMEKLIDACPPAGVIADPFAGSGTTLIAAKRLGRIAIGVEIDERYCELAARRLDQHALIFGA